MRLCLKLEGGGLRQVRLSEVGRWRVKAGETV